MLQMLCHTRGEAERKSSFLSALETSQVLHISMNVQLTYGPTFSTRWFKYCKRVNIPSATLQRDDNFVSGKHFATL